MAAGDVVGRVIEASAEANPLPAHVHVQLTPAGVAAPRSWWSRPSPRPGGRCPRTPRHWSAWPARDVPTDYRRRAPRPARRRRGSRPGALLRAPAAHRTRLASPPDRHLRPGLPRHGQQRRRRRAQPSPRSPLRPAGSSGCSTPTRGSAMTASSPTPSASSSCCPIRSTPCSSSTRGARPSTSPCASSAISRPARTPSAWPAGTTAGRQRPTRSRRRSTTTRTSRDTRPPWVHLAPMPNLYRGEHRGADAADRYADAVRSIVAQIPGGPAAFVAEPLSGNAGGVEMPTGLPAAGLRVRARRRRARDLRRGAGRVRPHRQ